MSSQTVYIVNGANRGIGLSIVSELSKDPANLIFAGARDVTGAAELHSLATKHGNVHVVKLRADSVEDNKAVALLVKEKAGKVDVVVANADPADFTAMFAIHVLGPLHLFQATRDIISDGGLFAVTSTALASIGHQFPDFPVGAVGTSKAALNYVVGRIRAENPHILTAAIHPGLVATDLAKSVLDNMSEAEQKAFGVITPAQAGEFYVRNLHKVRAEKPAKAVFLVPGGEAEEW